MMNVTGVAVTAYLMLQFAVRARDEAFSRSEGLLLNILPKPIAERLKRELNVQAPVGILDVSFYRDDFEQSGLKSAVRPSQIAFDVAGSHVLLVDDVLNTGRTVRAAMNEIFDYGRPAKIELAVLIDRGGRELPVAASIVGATIELPASVSVVLTRDDDDRLHLTMETRSDD